MTRRILIAALLVVPAPLAFGAQSEQPRHRLDRCGQDGGRTLMANRSVRLYFITSPLGNKYVRYCWIRTGRTTDLEATAGPPTQFLPELRIAGRYLATASVDFDRKQPIYPGVDLRVAVRDVKRDRCISAFHPDPAYSGRYDDGAPGVTDLELSSQGAVAWIASGAPNRDDHFYVQKADASGRAVLDEGPEIDTRSLAITGRRIFWMSGGVPKTAVLDGRARDDDCP